MPCKKCKDGKYKYGNTGECKYDTKEECDKANPNKYNKMKEYPTPLGKKTYEEYAKELKEFNLGAEPKLTKVELSVADDVNKARKKLEQVIKESEFSLKESKGVLNTLGGIDGVVTNMKIEERTVNKLVTELGDITIKMEKALKELGVNPKNQKPIIDADRIFQEGLQTRKELTGAIEKIVSKANKIK